MDPNEKQDDVFEDFDSAFADALADVKPVEKTKPVATPMAAEDVPDDDEDLDAAPAGDDIDEDADEDIDEDADEDVDAKPDAKAKPAKTPAADAKDAKPAPVQAEDKKEHDDLLARLADLMRNSATPEQVERQAANDKQPKEEAPPIYTEDEQKIINEYLSDYPESARAEGLIRRSEYRQLMEYVFAQVAEGLQPVMRQVDALATREHMNDIYQNVEDYDDVRDQVIAWVDSQPTYLQEPFKRVIAEGTSAEISDLISRWRNETKPATAAPKPVTTEKQDRELPEEARQAAKSLAPVRSKRSVVPKSDDPDDFESAFERAAAAAAM